MPTLYEYDSFGNLTRQTLALAEEPDSTNSPVTEFAYTLEQTEEGIFTCTAQTRYNASESALARTQKQLISQLSSTLAEKEISINERGLTSTDWTVYNEGTKRTRYSSAPTSTITAKIVMADDFSLSQKDTAVYTANALNQYTAIDDFVPTYDADGNQTQVKTSTGIWNIAYNAENRPVRFTRSEEDGTETQVTCTYDYMGRRATKKVTTNGTVTLHQRYIYRDYLQIACCDQTRANHPCLWLITWDPTQPIATRPLAIQKDSTWYAYGWDLTKNICEVLSSNGYINTIYTYTPYGEVTSSGSTTQPLQWSSEYSDTELGLVYYNYRHYNPSDGRWICRDSIEIITDYIFCNNVPVSILDVGGNIPIDTLEYMGSKAKDLYEGREIYRGMTTSQASTICDDYKTGQCCSKNKLIDDPYGDAAKKFANHLYLYIAMRDMLILALYALQNV